MQESVRQNIRFVTADGSVVSLIQSCLPADFTKLVLSVEAYERTVGHPLKILGRCYSNDMNSNDMNLNDMNYNDMDSNDMNSNYMDSNDIDFNAMDSNAKTQLHSPISNDRFQGIESRFQRITV